MSIGADTHRDSAGRWRGYFPIQAAVTEASHSKHSCRRIRNFAWPWLDPSLRLGLTPRQRDEGAAAKKFRYAGKSQSLTVGPTHEAGYQKALSPCGGEQPGFDPPTWSDEHRTLDLACVAKPERDVLLRVHRTDNIWLSGSVVIRDQRSMPPAALVRALDDGLEPS